MQLYYKKHQFFLIQKIGKQYYAFPTTPSGKVKTSLKVRINPKDFLRGAVELPAFDTEYKVNIQPKSKAIVLFTDIVEHIRMLLSDIKSGTVDVARNKADVIDAINNLFAFNAYDFRLHHIAKKLNKEKRNMFTKIILEHLHLLPKNDELTLGLWYEKATDYPEYDLKSKIYSLYKASLTSLKK